MTVEGLGNVKVWYRVYARSDVNTGTSDRSGFNVPRTARYQADIHDVLINTSHKGYENIDPVQLKTEEFLVPDNWMLALLQRLRELGYFNSSASGAVEIPMSPPDYVARLSKRPDKWIAVGHQGRYTLLAFNRDEFERDYKDHIPEYIRRKNEIYILSEEAVRSAKAHHLLKPIVGSGSGNPLGNQGRGSR